MLVNPSINISIGNHGEKYLTSFHDYFMYNEQELLNYASFYKFKSDNQILSYSKLAGNYNSNELIDSIELSGIENREDLFNQFSDSRFAYFFRNTINESYNKLVNLPNQLGISIDYNIVNINIIISNLEEHNTIILSKLVENITQLSSDGVINNVSLKVFVVLTENGALLKKQEELISYVNVEELKAIQKNNNNIFRNIIFIDDKNTSAVFLDINENSIGFVLNEFITYLMTNHYSMIGNLMNSEYISLGLGMLYFDSNYFTNYFKHIIISQKLKDELIIGEREIDEVFYLKETTDLLKPFLSQKGNITECINKIEEKLSDIKKQDNILLKYKYILASLLGKYGDIPGCEVLSHYEKISLYDVLFKSINAISLYIDKYQNIDILEHKKLLDQISELENNYLDLENENVDSLNDDKLLVLKAQLIERREKADKEKSQIKEIFFKLKNNQIIDEILSSEVLQKVETEIDNLNDNQKNIEEKRNTFLKRLFRPGLKKESIKINHQIESLTIKKNEITDFYTSVKFASTSAYSFINVLEKQYILLNKAIDMLLSVKSAYSSMFKSSKLLNYLFVKNVIKESLLNNYFENNKDALLNNLKDVSSLIFKFNNGQNDLNELKNFIETKIETSVGSIVDFNMVNYLNKEYDHLNIFIPEELSETIKDLLNISKPFINSHNSYGDVNFHKMMLHNKESELDVNRFHTALRNEFAATIPQQISTMNNHKFTILKVVILDDFNDIVKYNICKKTYDKQGDNKIVIT